MEWGLAGFAVVVLAAAAIVGSGRWGAMPPAIDDRHPGMVPDGVLDADDLRDVRFSVVPRGYSMQQVDALLARLADQLEAESASASDAEPANVGLTGPDADEGRERWEALAVRDEPLLQSRADRLGSFDRPLE